MPSTRCPPRSSNCLTPRAKKWQELTDALRTVFKSFHGVEAAWYYGSVARGTDTPASDFDLAVVMPGDQIEEAVDAIRNALRPLGDTFGVSFGTVGIAASEVVSIAAATTWWNSMTDNAITLKGPDPEKLLSRLQKGKT